MSLRSYLFYLRALKLANFYMMAAAVHDSARAVIKMLTICSSMNHESFLFDVGHGDCVLLKNNEGFLLVDCGAKVPARYKNVPKIVENRCGKDCGGLAVSHFHSDHYSLFDFFHDPGRLFSNIYVPDLPTSGSQRQIGIAMREFLWLANYSRYQSFEALPKIFQRTRKAPIVCHHGGDNIHEAGLEFEVIWPDLSHPILRKERIIKRARIVIKVIESTCQKHDIPLPQTESSLGEFLRSLIELPPSRLSEKDIRDVHVSLGRIEGIFSDDLANKVSLALESENPDSRLLFLGDLPSDVLDVVYIRPGRFHLIKTAHHGTEFGSSLEPVSADFVFVSRNEREFRINDIDPKYLDNFGAHVLNSQLLGSCHLKRFAPFRRKQKGQKSSAGCIVFTGKGKEIRFLLLRRKESANWDFPIGKPKDKDKSSRETALREVAEETGLTPTILRGFSYVSHYCDSDPISDWIYPFVYDGSVRLFIARAQNTDVRFQPSSEHDFYAWLPFQEAIERLILPNSRDALTKANEFVKPMSPCII